MEFWGYSVWLFLGIIAGSIIYLVVDRRNLPYDREIKISLTAGIIGSLFFAFFFAPVLVPFSQNLMIWSGTVDTPYPGIQAGYQDELPAHASGNFNQTDDLDYHQLFIWNPHSRPVFELSLGVDTKGCIDDMGVLTFIGTEPKGVDDLSWASPSRVEFSRAFEDQGAITRCDTGVFMRTLPPKSMIVVYFVVDTNPEDPNRVDFTDADVERGEIYVQADFMWRFNSVRKFEEAEPQVLPKNNSTQSINR